MHSARLVFQSSFFFQNANWLHNFSWLKLDGGAVRASPKLRNLGIQNVTLLPINY